MDIVTQMAAWGLDTLTPSASYLWMTGPDGTLPPHLQSYLKRTVTMPDGNTLFILGCFRPLLLHTRDECAILMGMKKELQTLLGQLEAVDGSIQYLVVRGGRGP